MSGAAPGTALRAAEAVLPSVGLVLQSGLDAVVERYAHYGPFLASFLANLLATFGDKGQLVVVMLASRYDARRVFAGAMAAFGLWSALEVLFGQWLTSALPGEFITLVTGGLFLCFGAWTYVAAIRSFRAADHTAVPDGTGLGTGLTGDLLPDAVLARVGDHGGVLASFLFVLLAEFGDKTQLLTIDLAATFSGAPVAVFAGVVAALGLRTGVDAFVGGRVNRRVPTRHVQLGAAVVFIGFGLVVLGAVPAWFLFGVLATLGLLALAALLGGR